MSDNEYERFEITDYDIENEFNPNRGRRRQTKHQQIYGIWADDSEAEEEEELTGRRGRGRKPKDYSAPVSFVAGGIQQSGKKPKDEDLEDDDDDNQITDEEDDERPSFGKKPIQIDISSESSSESEKESRPPPKTKTPGFGSRQSGPSGITRSGLATWEAHTKGIGAKLLLQMGYEPGKGLGKDLQGISRPVEAHMRKGRGAIGAYGPEKAAALAKQQLQQAEAIQEDERENKEFKDKMNMWKKDEKSDKDKKRRHYYRSVQEVIEKGKRAGALGDKFSNKLSNVPVIDMTGPERRVLSGYHALSQARIDADEDIYEHRPAKKCTNFALPELMHNLSLIVDMCEQEIIAIDKEDREAADKSIQLQQEEENLKKIVKLENEYISTLDKALELVESLTDYPETLTLAKAEQTFVKLQTEFPNEYKEFGLGDLAAGVIAPLVNQKLSEWKPLQDPTRYVDIIKKWRTILGMHQSETRNVFDPYSSLIWAGVIPSIRNAAAVWNPKCHQQMAALLDTWAPMFPTWILDNVLEQLILPQLTAAVTIWDPLTDTVPIHVWILPWSGILSHKLEEFIYPMIREKLGNALQAWVPQDRSARAMITPWKSAFPDGEMQSFLLKYIIPKLQVSLSEMVINPLQQDLELWNQVWEWHELISPLLMAQLLDKFFFPKWMQTLVIWLNQSPNLDQISRWYTGWKSLLSEDLLQQINTKEHFRRALELMHRATATTGILETTPITTPQPQPQASTNVLSQPPALMDLQIEPPPQLEFKDLVSQRCADRGIIFVPMPGRREFGKQVYRIGKLFCYIDRSVLMVSDGSFSSWTPTSLGLILERAISG